MCYPHQVNVGQAGSGLQVIANNFPLPFLTKSIDACLLAQTLCYTNDPHRLLRELDRVLIDNGWLVISGFNPFSLVGIGKLLPWLKHRQPYVSHMLPQMQMLDWMSLLNYEVLHQARFQVIPWQKKSNTFLSTHLPALGCMNVIVSRKRALPLTHTDQYGNKKTISTVGGRRNEELLSHYLTFLLISEILLGWMATCITRQ